MTSFSISWVHLLDSLLLLPSPPLQHHCPLCFPWHREGIFLRILRLVAVSVCKALSLNNYTGSSFTCFNIALFFIYSTVPTLPYLKLQHTPLKYCSPLPAVLCFSIAISFSNKNFSFSTNYIIYVFITFSVSFPTHGPSTWLEYKLQNSRHLCFAEGSILNAYNIINKCLKFKKYVVRKYSRNKETDIEFMVYSQKEQTSD